MKKSDEKVIHMVQAAMIAAVYVALTLPIQPIAYGPIQFRVSEALTILPYFTSAAIPGVTIGCFLSNILMGAPLPDIIFGTLATLIGTIFSRMLRRQKFLVCIPPILSNALIIPWVLKFAYEFEDAVPFMMLTVGAGEVLAAGVLGTMLLLALERCKNMVFGVQSAR
ncbi:MAG: QueT transporter family protein [Lachnospiraceae bacterium]|nr:QueT transporter family protein [Lachnospiraceae bacterium]